LKDFGFFQRIFWRFGVFFCMLKYLSFHNSSFALRYFLKCKWQGHTQCDTPLVMNWVRTCTGLLVQKVGLQPNHMVWNLCVFRPQRLYVSYESRLSPDTSWFYHQRHKESLSCAIMLTTNLMVGKNRRLQISWGGTNCKTHKRLFCSDKQGYYYLVPSPNVACQRVHRNPLLK
jgi:hypothetical protein